METKMSYMTYSAVHYLEYDISSILYPSNDPLVSPVVEEILEFAHKEAKSLKEIAKRTLVSGESRLVTDIVDAVSGLRKALQPFDLESESSGDETDIPIDEINILNLKQEVDFFSERVKTMEAKMKEYDVEYSSRIASGGGQRKSKIVGFSDLCTELAYRVALNWGEENHRFIGVPIYGMAGIGKTTFAKEFFDDRLSLGIDFDCRAWVTVGRNPQFKEIIRIILHQVNPHSDQMLMEGDENMSEYLKDSLRGRKYLMVLDDVWDKWVITEMDCLFPDNHGESLVLLTTRLQEITETFDKYIFIEMRLLDKEESWNLLREKVFGEEECPFKLEEPGKKIVEHCDGLPLTIVTVADLLSKTEKTWQYWDELAAKRNHQLFKDAYNEISEVLLPSYEHLTQILQMCFLYMGVFPQNYKIPLSKLISMWCTDGFPERNVDKFSNDDARECLKKLVSNSLVVICESTIDKLSTFKKQIKTCRLHSSFWHLSNREAGKIHFCRVLNSPNDCLREGLEKQLRLSFHNNILTGIKDVYSAVEDNCASTTCSLLFYGPYH